MPRRGRGRNLSRRTYNARATAGVRASQSDERRAQRNEVERQRIGRSRSRLSGEEREAQNAQNRERMARNRSNQNASQYNLTNRVRRQSAVRDVLYRAAFNYNNTIDYASLPAVSIGVMNTLCEHCNAIKYKNETPGLCCASGKVKLPPLNLPPEPLRTLVSGTTAESKHFLKNIQSYNSCFQMTSFGATNIITHGNFMPTFKVIYINSERSYNFDPNTDLIYYSLVQIQGQVYHNVGSLLPYADANYQFLQIYFIGNPVDELNQRCTISSNVRREIVSDLQDLFHQHNELVRLFKTALDRMPSDDHRVVIRGDKTPAGQHARRFNAPTIDDVAIVIVGEQFNARDIVIRCRNDQLQRVSELNRSYDALQYPILFWQGEDGYHIQVKLHDPRTGN